METQKQQIKSNRRKPFLFKRSVWYRPENSNLIIIETRLKNGQTFYKELEFKLSKIWTDTKENPINEDNTSDEYYRENGYRYIAGGFVADKTQEIEGE
jgi:hypothetical protein